MKSKLTFKIIGPIPKNLRGTRMKGSMAGCVDEIIHAPQTVNSWYLEQIRIQALIDEKKSILSQFMTDDEIKSFYFQTSIEASGQPYLSNSDYIISKLNQLIDEYHSQT